MTQARNYRVGIEIIPQEKVTAALKKLAKEFRDLDKQATALAKKVASIGAGGSKPGQAGGSDAAKAAQARKQALADAKTEDKLAQERAKTEAKIAQIRSKESAVAEVNRQREQRANLETMRYKDRSAALQRMADRQHQDAVGQAGNRQRAADTAHETSLKRQQGLQEQLNRAAERGATQQAIATERLNQARMRSDILARRQARATAPRLTADQQYVQHQRDRVGAAMDAGNRISTAGAVARAGLSPALALVHLGHDEAVHENMKERAGLDQMNLSEADQRQALAGADRVRRDVRGLGDTGSIDVVKDLVNVTGHVTEATNPELMKRFAQFSVSNKVAYGLNRTQSLNAIKSAELLTPNFKGMTEEQQVHAILANLELEHKVMGGTGGRVNPNEFMNFVKTAQSSRMSLSQQGLIKLVPIMQEMSGNRTGTSLMSLMQNLANGRATTQSVKNLLDMGLINTRVNGKSMVEYDKTGQIKRMLPGAIKGDELLRQDPVKWTEQFILPKVKGLNTAQLDRKINSILGNRTAAGLMMTMVSQDARINKDAHIINNAKGIEATEVAQQSSYMRQSQNVDAAFDTAKVRAWQAAAPVVTKGLDMMSGALEHLNNAVTDHPVAAQIGVLGTAIGGIGTSIVAASVAARAGIVAWRALTAAEAAATTATATMGTTAATAATGFGLVLGQLALVGGVAAGVGYSLGRLAGGIQNLLGAWDKEKRDLDRVNYLQTQNQIKFGGAKPFPARVGGDGPGPKPMPVRVPGAGRPAAMFDSGLVPVLTEGNSAARSMRDAANASGSAPILPSPRLEGAGGITLHIDSISVGSDAPMEPDKARPAARKVARKLEDTVFDALTGARGATSVPTIIN